MLTHFDFADLRLFIRIAEENSLTRGAERVHMSLPAASTRIKNLEEALGAKLLYRASNGVTLTPPGTGAAAARARRAASDGAPVLRPAGICAGRERPRPAVRQHDRDHRIPARAYCRDSLRRIAMSMSTCASV